MAWHVCVFPTEPKDVNLIPTRTTRMDVIGRLKFRVANVELFYGMFICARYDIFHLPRLTNIVLLETRE